jgi:hypothetical protein
VALQYLKRSWALTHERFLYSVYTRERISTDKWSARRKGLYLHRTADIACLHAYCLQCCYK